MRLLMCLLPAGVLLFAQSVSAQMQPHRADYILRLGTAINAPRVGTATQDLTLDCTAWHLKRDVKGEVPISATWKFDVASTLDSEEGRSGGDLRYRARQIQNGAEREVKGTVERAGGEWKADSRSPDGSAHVLLPTLTRMPVDSIGHVIDRLRGGSASFSMLSFDPQGSGEAFRVHVAQIVDSALRRRPPSEEPVDVVGPSWPIEMTFRRGSKDKPAFSLTARLFASGVLDRVTVNADVVTVAADLKTVQMHPSPSCR